MVMSDDIPTGSGAGPPSFNYGPLDASRHEIRILVPLRPGDGVAAREITASDNGGQATLISDPDDAELIVQPDLTLHFSLEVVSLLAASSPSSSPSSSHPPTDVPSYTALSYVWGDPAPVNPIFVDGHPVLVTRNLHSALSQLCYDDIQPAVWIDSVCIDQSNSEEKESQVRMMGTIYRGARRVIVWLGEGDGQDGAEEVRHARFIRELTRARERLRQTVPGGASTVADLAELSGKALREAVTTLFGAAAAGDRPLSVLRRSLDFMFMRPWWYRVWIIQEFALAPECRMRLGRVCFEPDECWSFLDVGLMQMVSGTSALYDAALELEDPESASMMATLADGWVGKLLRLRQTRQAKLQRSPATIFAFLCLAYCQEVKSFAQKVAATDRRDYIYGLVGLCAEDYESSLRLRVDYSKSWQEVYSDTASALIASGELDLLSLCQNLDTAARDATLPSWSPRWHEQMRPPGDSFTSSVQGGRIFGNGLYATGGSTKVDVSFSTVRLQADDGSSCPVSVRVMRLAGATFDTITEVRGLSHPLDIHEWQEFGSIRGLLKDVRALCKQARRRAPSASASNADPHSRASTLPDAVWRIPLRDVESTLHLGDSSGPMTRRCTAHNRIHYYLTYALDSMGEERQIWLQRAGSWGRWPHLAYWTGYLVSILAVLLWAWLNHSLFGGPALSFVSISGYSSGMTTGPPKRPFISTRGLVGLAPAAAEPGDKIVVFYGARMPHVVRQVEGSNGMPAYILLGDAYAHGIMDGEFMADGPDREVFDIY